MTERSVDARPTNTIGLAAIFAAFFRLGGTSFGGGTAGWLLSRDRRAPAWIDDREFLSDAALGRFMPGLGRRQPDRSGRPALCAAPPAPWRPCSDCCRGRWRSLLALAIGYTRVGRKHVGCTPFLDGVAAVAIGLTFATGLKLVRSERRAPARSAVTAATVLCVGVLRWPMIPVVLCLAPVSIGLALRRQARPPCLTTSGRCWRWCWSSRRCRCCRSAAAPPCSPISSTNPSRCTTGRRSASLPISSRCRGRRPARARCSRR